jgi:hypothetical protein
VATCGTDKVVGDTGGATRDVEAACGTVGDTKTTSSMGMDIEAMPSVVMDVKTTSDTGRDTGATRGATTVSRVPATEGGVRRSEGNHD